MGIYAAGGNLYETIMAVIGTLPMPQIVLVLLILSMVAFYATSFDSITLVASAYSYRKLAGRVGTDENDDDKAEEDNEQAEASSGMKLFWAILLIMLPIALIFSEGSMNNLQTVSIIAAFPIGLVIILIIASLIRETGEYLKELEV
jgi:BCCT family betaine/carnitine transporter